MPRVGPSRTNGLSCDRRGDAVVQTLFHRDQHGPGHARRSVRGRSPERKQAASNRKEEERLSSSFMGYRTPAPVFMA